MHTCIPKCIKLAVKMFTFLNVLGESNLKTISIGWFWPLRFQLIHPSSKKVFFCSINNSEYWQTLICNAFVYHSNCIVRYAYLRFNMGRCINISMFAEPNWMHNSTLKNLPQRPHLIENVYHILLRKKRLFFHDMSIFSRAETCTMTYSPYVSILLTFMSWRP